MVAWLKGVIIEASLVERERHVGQAVNTKSWIGPTLGSSTSTDTQG